MHFGLLAVENVLPQWELLAVPLIGLAFGGLAFALGRFLTAREAALTHGPAPVHAPVPAQEQETPFLPAVQPLSRETPVPALVQPLQRETPPPAAISIPDRRYQTRIRIGQVEVLITDPESGSVLSSGWITDRSLAGLGLHLERALKVGAVVHVRVRHDAIGVPWTPMIVKFCRQRGDGWKTGCEFVQASSWEVMERFGKR
jgi:hypothetical protein